MEQIGNFLKVGDVRILISNLIRYGKRRENWVRQPDPEADQVPMVAWCVDFFHRDTSGLVHQDTIHYVEEQPEGGAPMQTEADADALLDELDEFFTGYKAKDGYGERK